MTWVVPRWCVFAGGTGGRCETCPYGCVFRGREVSVLVVDRVFVLLHLPDDIGDEVVVGVWYGRRVAGVVVGVSFVA